MASLFGARRWRPPEDDGEDSDGSGSDRAKRRRLSPEGTSPGWLSTFVSGARMVLSTVLFSSSSQEELSEEEEEEDSSEAGQGIIKKKGEKGTYMHGWRKDGNEDAHNSNGAVAPYSDSKLATEQMVMKESFSSAAKDVADRSGDVNSVPAEPEIHQESHMNSTSESRPKDAAPQTEISLRALKKQLQTNLSGSTNRTSANGLLDRSDGNSGVES